MTKAVWKIRIFFFQLHLTSASENASGTKKVSNFLEYVEQDARELAVDGDSADCFGRGENEVRQFFLKTASLSQYFSINTVTFNGPFAQSSV